MDMCISSLEFLGRDRMVRTSDMLDRLGMDRYVFDLTSHHLQPQRYTGRYCR